MYDLGGLTLFVRVAELRSFSAAAEHSGMTASGVSRAIARLEKHLGAQLLDRTTRRVDLTRDGLGFYRRCRQVLADIEDAAATLKRTSISPQGRLRVQLPVGFGKRVIVPALPRFAERYPGIVLDVELNDRSRNLSRDQIDVAVQVGHVQDSRLAARRLCTARFVTCAAPAYLKQRGIPRTPGDMKNHRCLGYFIPQTGRYREWEFLVNSVERSRAIHGNLNINNGEALLDAMLAGGGIATIATFVAADAVAGGRLQVVLHDFIARGPDVSIVYLPGNRQSPAVRAFVDYVVDLVPSSPPWDAIADPRFKPSSKAARSMFALASDAP